MIIWNSLQYQVQSLLADINTTNTWGTFHEWGTNRGPVEIKAHITCLLVREILDMFDKLLYTMGGGGVDYVLSRLTGLHILN